MSVRGMEPLHVYSIESQSTPGKNYTVAAWPNGKFTCTCPAFVLGRHNKGRDIWSRQPCKHIHLVEDQIDPNYLTGNPEPKEDLEVKEVDRIDPRIRNILSLD